MHEKALLDARFNLKEVGRVQGRLVLDKIVWIVQQEETINIMRPLVAPVNRVDCAIENFVSKQVDMLHELLAVEQTFDIDAMSDALDCCFKPDHSIMYQLTKFPRGSQLLKDANSRLTEALEFRREHKQFTNLCEDAKTEWSKVMIGGDTEGEYDHDAMMEFAGKLDLIDSALMTIPDKYSSQLNLQDLQCCFKDLEKSLLEVIHFCLISLHAHMNPTTEGDGEKVATEEHAEQNAVVAAAAVKQEEDTESPFFQSKICIEIVSALRPQHEGSTP